MASCDALASITLLLYALRFTPLNTANTRAFAASVNINNHCLLIRFRVCVNPKQPHLFKDLYKETIIRNHDKVGLVESR